jgi:hypothetical protein
VRKESSGSVVEPGPNGSQYITGFSRAKTESFSDDLGLIVLVRQDAAIALAPLAELKHTILVFLLLFAGHAVVFNWVLSTKVVAPCWRSHRRPTGCVEPAMHVLPTSPSSPRCRFSPKASLRW